MEEEVNILPVRPPFHDHDSNHRFKPGNTGGSGRPKGSRNHLSSLFWNDLYAVWKAKGMGVLERLADDDPSTFVKVAAMLVGKAEDLRDATEMRDTAMERFIEERRQEALKMIANMKEQG